eukprot:333423-Heterocapsa_arctica.AAC.1
MIPFGEGGAGGSAEQEKPAAEKFEEQRAKEEEVGQAPVLKKGPVMPIEREIRRYMATQVRWRERCFHCMAERGRNDPHRTGCDDRKEEQVPTVAMDYSIPKSKKEDGGGQEEATEGQEEAAEDADEEVARGECGPTTLIARDEKEDKKFATAVPAKGPARPWTARRVGRRIDFRSREHILLKTNGKRDMVRLAQDIKGQMIDSGETTLEHHGA